MRQKLLGSRTGMRVSELALGCGMLGNENGVGDASVAMRTLASYADAGGTLIDTSSSHQDGRSEEFVGDFLRQAGRENFVVSTKYGRRPASSPRSLLVGSHRGAMISQVEASLARLKTDHVDLYSVEFPDGVTPVEEILRGLDDLVRQGKVLAVGLSNFAAWSLGHAATVADFRGWAPVAAVPPPYKLLDRSIEGEQRAAAAAFGMGLLAWSPQARGSLARPHDPAVGEGLRAILVDLAGQHGSTTGAIALAWLLSRDAIPVVGARNVDQLAESLAATGIALAPEQLRRLDEATAEPRAIDRLIAQQRDAIGIGPQLLSQAAPIGGSSSG